MDKVTTGLNPDIRPEHIAPSTLHPGTGETVVDNELRRQEVLLKAGALQNAIFNSANFSSIATDANGVIQIFNVGAERMLGYSAADVMNKITPADISDPQEVIARAKALSVELSTPITPGFEALVFKASRGIEDIYELTYIRKDGSRFPAVVSVTALRDDQDRIIGYLLIGTDNTARKEAEEALLKAGALQNAIFNSANFSSIATDAKGVIQIFNVGAERMLGYSAADVMNKITPADISDPQEVIIRAKALSVELSTPITPGFEALVFKASRGIEDIYELTYIRKDGSRFPAVVSVTALRDDQNAIIGYLLIGTDNTARKEIEADKELLNQRLRDHQFYTRSLFESNIDALMTSDPSGIITDVNKQMEALTDCTRDELIGAPLKSCFTDPEQAEMGIKLVLSKKKVTDYELTVRARDGKETVVSLNCTTFYDRNRKLQGVFAAARDITERKRLDKALQDQNAELENAKSVAEIRGEEISVKNRQLEEADHLKSEFLANMSHELRTPLNSIIGFSEVLVDGLRGDLTVGQKEYVEQILGSGRHLLSLINDILDLSKVEAGRMELAIEPLEIATVLRDSLSIVMETAGVHRVELQCEPAQDLGVLHADARKIKQILFNLLSNAVKFTPDGGSVRLEAKQVDRTQADRIFAAGMRTPLPVSDHARFIEISVSDTGIGIPAKGLTRLFQPFSQIESSLSRTHSGTGLGLAMVRKMAGLHGGGVGVQSEEDKGSIFFVWLPYGLDQSPPVEPVEALAGTPDFGQSSETPGLGGIHSPAPKVLVVDDDPKALEILSTVLQSRGFAVEQASGVQEAMDTVQRESFDLVMLDLLMTEVSGFDVVEALKTRPDTAAVPILALTAKQLTNADRTRLNGLVTTIMVKSEFNPETFVAAVHRVLLMRQAGKA